MFIFFEKNKIPNNKKQIPKNKPHGKGKLLLGQIFYNWINHISCCCNCYKHSSLLELVIVIYKNKSANIKIMLALLLFDKPI